MKSVYDAKCRPAKLKRQKKLLDEKSWTRETIPACFLGSLAKRTGCLFAGVDDLIVRKPRFRTNMSMSVPSAKINVRGSFEKTVMRRQREIATISNEFLNDAYSLIYVGGLYPFVQHKNSQAPINRKVLLIGDSYSRPVEAFLSTAIKSLDVIDLRRCDDKFNLSKFVTKNKPDIIMQMLSPSSFIADKIGQKKSGSAAMFTYGLRHSSAKSGVEK